AADLPATSRAEVDTPPAITYPFEIPAQPLDQALLAFSRQTGLAVMVATSGKQSSPIPDTQAPPVKGEYSAEAAMGLLLARTEFRYRRVDGQGMVILPPRQEKIAQAPL